MGRRAKQRRDAIRRTGGRSPAARTRRSSSDNSARRKDNRCRERRHCPAGALSIARNCDMVRGAPTSDRLAASESSHGRRPDLHGAGKQTSISQRPLTIDLTHAGHSGRSGLTTSSGERWSPPVAWSVQPPCWSAITCAAAGRTGSVSLPTGAHWRQEASSPAYALKRRSAPRSDTTLAPRASGQVAFALAMVRRPVFP
jgi:hypothetical protein